MKLTLSTLLGLTLFSVVSALPASLRELSTSHLPKGAAKLAFDDDAGLVYAFDEYGKKLGVVDPLKSTRDVQNNAGTCSPLSAEDVKKRKPLLIPSLFANHQTHAFKLVPKWTALTDKAKANWGGGSHDVRTNMEDVCARFPLPLPLEYFLTILLLLLSTLITRPTCAPQMMSF